MKVAALAVALACVAISSIARADDVPVQTQEGCQAQADAKKLKGAAATSFVKKCVADSGKSSAATDGAAVPAEKKAACEADADAKKLAGAAKTSFIKKCVATDVSNNGGTAASIPKEKIDACKAEASAKKLKGDERKAYVKSCAQG